VPKKSDDITHPNHFAATVATRVREISISVDFVAFYFTVTEGGWDKKV
jgi:hypothetical protein